MKKGTSRGMKSALEIAMEKIDGGGGPPKLSEEQKREIAEAEKAARAGIAEIEIMMAQRLAEARAAGDMEGVARLEEEKANEISRLQRKAERRKREIRGTGEDVP